MMKRFFIYCCLCVFGIESFAQLDYSSEEALIAPPLLSFQQSVNLGLLDGLGYSVEVPVMKNILIYAYPRAGYFGSFKDFGLVFFARLGLEARHYYNRNKRFLKGKKMDENAGDFIGLSFVWEYLFLSKSQKGEAPPFNAYFPNVFWGMRRPLGKQFYVELLLGVSYKLLPNENLSHKNAEFILGISTFSYQSVFLPFLSIKVAYAFPSKK